MDEVRPDAKVGHGLRQFDLISMLVTKAPPRQFDGIVDDGSTLATELGHHSREEVFAKIYCTAGLEETSFGQ